MLVKKVEKSKSGKSFRVFDGKGWFGASIDSGIEQMLGKSINAKVEESEFGPWITGFSEGNAPQAAKELAASQTDRWWSAFVSNQVAHAVAAGLIKNPNDMAGWAKHAYRAITKCQEPFVDDKDIDF